jgi:hypothetical protein
VPFTADELAVTFAFVLSDTDAFFKLYELDIRADESFPL